MARISDQNFCGEHSHPSGAYGERHYVDILLRNDLISGLAFVRSEAWRGCKGRSRKELSVESTDSRDYIVDKL